MRNNTTYCQLCKKNFRSNQALRMHYFASKNHRKQDEKSEKKDYTLDLYFIE